MAGYDVTLNFLANLMIAVGLLFIWPMHPRWKERLAALGIVGACLLNLAQMLASHYRNVQPSELVLNCILAYYVTVLIAEHQMAKRASRQQKGTDKQ